MCWAGLQGWLTSCLLVAAPPPMSCQQSGLLKKGILLISGFLAFMNQHKGKSEQVRIFFFLNTDPFTL
jgi:hypothetical protein